MKSVIEEEESRIKSRLNMLALEATKNRENIFRAFYIPKLTHMQRFLRIKNFQDVFSFENLQF